MFEYLLAEELISFIVYTFLSMVFQFNNRNDKVFSECHSNILID